MTAMGDRGQFLVRRAARVMGSGTVIVIGTVLASNLLRLVSSVILTRLLDASTFAIVAFLTSLQTVMVMLSDIGVFTFVVRHKEGNDPRFLDEIWTIRAIRCFALAAVMALASGWVASYLHQPAIQLAVVVFTLTWVFEGLSSMAFTTAVRQQALRRLSGLDVGTAVVQLLLSTLLAVWLRSYWALVIAIVVAAAVKALLSYLLFPGQRRAVALSRDRAREVWTFSRFIAISSMLTVALAQVDKLVFARLFDLYSYGIYVIAAQLAVVPTVIVAQYANRILYPVYSELFHRSHEAFVGGYYKTKRMVTLLYMAGVGGLIGGAPLLVAILYDPRYQAVAGYLRILAISSLLLINNWAANQALVATGRSSNMLHMNIARCLWLVGAGIIGYFVLGSAGLVWAVGTVEVAASVYSWTRLRQVGLLNVREEALGYLAAAGGLALGWAVSGAALYLYPNL